MPEVSVQPLDAERPEWGRVFVVPWDTDIFGFPVGTYEPGDARAVHAGREAFGRRFRDWAASRQVELVSGTVAADERVWRTVLPELGFTCVTADDHAQIEEIAGRTFRHGRYNADPRFPPALADRRYRHWIRSACTSASPADRVYVVGKSGNVKGFFQLRLAEDRAEVGIMGVAESAKGSPAALDLMTGMHLDLKGLGIRWITAKISAGNTRVINLVAHFGYRFRSAKATFHWHAPDARHLLPRGTIS